MTSPVAAALVLRFCASSVVAQESLPPAHASLRDAAVRHGVQLSQASQPASQPAPPQSWRARHPSTFGALIGAGAGAGIGALTLAANCHSGVEGVCSPPGGASWMGLFAGIGAGSGAAISAIVAGRK